jgi:hypothetical protein
MNAMLFTAAMLVFGMQDVETAPQAKTQLYVKTVPDGAEVTLDGKLLGKSDALFDIASGPHRLSLQLEGYVPEGRLIDAREGEITRVELHLRKRSGKQTVLSYVGDAQTGAQSYADGGHAVAFERSAEAKSVVAVKLFGTRYGYDTPPEEDFHIYLLDRNRKVLEDVAVPYRKITKGTPRWFTIGLPPVEVPEKFYVAVWFNAEATKGFFMGKENTDKATHSFAGLPDKGFRKVEQSFEWMIRAVVSSEDGKKPSYPKVTTYPEEKAADTESRPAQPEKEDDEPAEEGGKTPRGATRTWNDASGTFSLEAEFVGVKDGKVMLKKTNGKTVAVPLDRLSKEDRVFVAEQTKSRASTTKPPAAPARKADELSHDDGQSAGQSSMAGRGHAVKFTVDGNSYFVTSVSLYGSRYGMPKPPPEQFRVWICDKDFRPIATFRFPYSAYVRENAVWKSFSIRPTKVPKEFIVCFGFNPQQTKGVYVSYDGKPSQTSLVGLPGKVEPQPFTKGNWLIRCKVENRGESGTSEAK